MFHSSRSVLLTLLNVTWLSKGEEGVNKTLTVLTVLTHALEENTYWFKHERWSTHARYYLGLDARKPVFGGLLTTQARTSLRVRAD